MQVLFKKFHYIYFKFLLSCIFSRKHQVKGEGEEWFPFCREKTGSLGALYLNLISCPSAVKIYILSILSLAAAIVPFLKQFTTDYSKRSLELILK